MKKNNSHGIKIELKNCAKRYEHIQALEPLNLSIAAGETIVLLGPSGCGKTTMLRIIDGLEEVDKGGQILFDGEDVTSLPIEKRNVGMVFQSYALFPNMNVYDNIAYGLKIAKMKKSKIKDRVNELLAMMNIEALKDRRIDQLSGGQRQRVALARAIATRPKVLLLDEPLSALDALLRNSLRIEIDRLLKKLGITAIYVTHDQSEAMALGDRIVVMQHGKVVQIGTPSELYHKPANNFTAEFIGTINCFSGNYKSGLVNIKNRTFSAGHLVDEGEINVLFRPEKVVVTELDDALFHGKLISTLFLGNETRLMLDVGDEREVIVETKEHDKYKIGETIGFRIHESDLIFMPKDK